jgi:hypothetical protein
MIANFKLSSQNQDFYLQWWGEIHYLAMASTGPVV